MTTWGAWGGGRGDPLTAEGDSARAGEGSALF